MNSEIIGSPPDRFHPILLCLSHLAWPAPSRRKGNDTSRLVGVQELGQLVGVGQLHKVAAHDDGSVVSC